MSCVKALEPVCAPSRCIEAHDTRELAKATEHLKHLVWQKAHALIKRAQGRPVLYSYQADGTPTTTRVTFRRQVGLTKFQRGGWGLVPRALCPSRFPQDDWPITPGGGY